MVTQCEDKLYTRLPHKFKCLNSCQKACKIKRLVSLRVGDGSRLGLEVGPCSVPGGLPWAWGSQQEDP